MRTWILSIIGFCALLTGYSQTPLTPPLPAGSTYYKGMIVSQRGIGVIGCDNTEFLLADGSGCASALGGVSKIIPGTNITCTPDVLGNCVGNVTVNATGNGPIPANATLLYTGTSINDDDTQVLAQPVTITGWSTTSHLTTVTNSGTNGFTAGQWINMRFASSWASCASGGLPLGEGAGTGCTIFQVLSTGLSTTQFEISTSLITAGTCGASCGTAYSAMSYLPFATSGSASMPSTVLANTVVFLPSPITIAGIVSGYTAFIHPHSPAVTGAPGYLIINNNNNDAATCTAAIATEASYQTLFSEAHADGFIVVVGTPTGAFWSQAGLGCSTAYTLQYQVDQWLRTQGKNAVLAASATSTSYWDVISDLHSVLWDGSNTNNIAPTDSTFAPAGADLASRTLASDIASGTGKILLANPLWYGDTDESTSSNATANLYVPFSGTNIFDFVWTNAARSVPLMRMTDTGNLSLWGLRVGSTNVGCPGDRAFCITVDGHSDLSFDGSDWWGLGGGIHASSGASNTNCYNTNGGVTACSASAPPSTPSLGTCAGGTITGTSTAFSVTGITAGTLSCTINFSPSLNAGVCVANSDAISGPVSVFSISTSSVTFSIDATTSALYSMCQ